jgi:A/G-specific adenine glycosylase
LKPASNNILHWYQANRRDLPWRIQINHSAFRDPYMVWISEIMLQQTRVQAVKEHFTRWMKAFPTVLALAQAPVEQVLQAWKGLGYYTRAKNIHNCAKLIVKQYHGEFPQSALVLQKLPGIGPYTAGAICSLAFNQPAPVVDGNIIRIFSRVYALDFLPHTTAQKKLYWEYARQWVASGPPAQVNEGLIELGALVCTPRSPDCVACPLQNDCRAFGQNQVEEFPPPRVQKEKIYINGSMMILQVGTEYLLIEPLKKQLLGGLYTFPWLVHSNNREPTSHQILQKAGLLGAHLGTIKHAITHHVLELEVLYMQVPASKIDHIFNLLQAEWQPRCKKWQLVAAVKVSDYLVSSLPGKAWALLQNQNIKKGESPTAFPFA